MGVEIALLRAKEGGRVVVNDLGALADGDGAHVDGAQETVNDIKVAGSKAFVKSASVPDPMGATSIIEEAVKAYGRIDVHHNGWFNISKAATP